MAEARAELERLRQAKEELVQRLTAGEDVRAELNAAVRRSTEIHGILAQFENRPMPMYGPPAGLHPPSRPGIAPVPAKTGSFFSRLFRRK